MSWKPVYVFLSAGRTQACGRCGALVCKTRYQSGSTASIVGKSVLFIPQRSHPTCAYSRNAASTEPPSCAVWRITERTHWTFNPSMSSGSSLCTSSCVWVWMTIKAKFNCFYLFLQFSPVFLDCAKVTLLHKESFLLHFIKYRPKVSELHVILISYQMLKM